MILPNKYKGFDAVLLIRMPSFYVYNLYADLSSTYQLILIQN
jgi:hypothetical protein